MQLIKLDATESTNTYLKGLMTHIDLIDFTVISTQEQSKGKGQRDSNWVSEKGKNLTISVLKKDLDLNIQYSFLISEAVSLAVVDTLRQLKIPNIKIKWPNDILSGDYKVCGILIENSLQGFLIKNSILGIGLNVNQVSFKGIPKASSISNLTGQTFNLEMILNTLVNNLKSRLNYDIQERHEDIFQEYHQNLYKKGQISDFVNADGVKFKGTIKGVSNKGKLIVDTDYDGEKKFEIKEIKLLY